MNPSTPVPHVVEMVKRRDKKLQTLYTQNNNENTMNDWPVTDMTGKLVIAKVKIGDMPSYHAEPRDALEFVTAEWKAALEEGEPFDCVIEHVLMTRDEFEALPEWSP